MTNKRLMIGGGALLAVVLALGVGVGFRMLSDGDESSKPPITSSTSQPPSTDCPAASSELVEFRPEGEAVAVSYPSDWQRLESGDPAVRLLVTPNQRDSFLMRINDRPPGLQDPAALKAFTGDLLEADAVQVVEGPVDVEVGGLPGHSYGYRFVDPGSGQRGAHRHYFLFSETKMIALVFQALPEECLPTLDPLFERIVSSFHKV